MILKGGISQYEVGGKVAETSTYRVYVCMDVGGERQYLLQIATKIEHNGGLERATYVLRELKKTSDDFEAEYAKRELGGLLSYNRLFPEVVDGFIAQDQDGRRVNILAFTEVETVTQMVPLSNLLAKDQLRVDQRSSAWIMGRLLKLLAFVHGEKIAVRVLSGSNILLEKDRHFAVVFDWSSVQLYQESVPSEERKNDIAGAAKAVLAAIGVDADTGSCPYEDVDARYVEFLCSMASRRVNNAEKAHTEFYELVEELWGREFRPFMTLPL